MNVKKQSLILTIFCFWLGSGMVFAQNKKASKEELKGLKYVEGDESGNELKALKTELLVAESEKKAIAFKKA